MSDILERNSYDARRVEMRRIVIFVASLLVASCLWYIIRKPLTYHLACSAIGCLGREELIGSVVRRNDSTLPYGGWKWYHNFADPDWIAFWSPNSKADVVDSAQSLSRYTTVLDKKLRVQGQILGDHLAIAPDDADTDGSSEVVVEFDLRDGREQVNARRWAVVRLRGEFNEIVWAGLGCSEWRPRKARVAPLWDDRDGDGIRELTFVTVELMQTPDGRWVYRPPTTVAIFDWDSPGGMLRPRSLPKDGSIIPWANRGNAPVRVPKDAELDILVRDLLPLPPAFGQ